MPPARSERSLTSSCPLFPYVKASKPTALTGCASTDSQNPLRRLYAVRPRMLLRGKHTRPKTKDRERPKTGADSGVITAKSAKITRKTPIIAESHVQQVVAGELGLVGDEGEAGLGLGPHQPLHRIGGAFAVVGQQHHAQQGAFGRIHGGF